MRSPAAEQSIASSDPLLAAVRLPLTSMHFPLGFAVELSSNSAEVMRAAEQSWSGRAKRFDSSLVRLSIGVAADAPEGCAEPPVFRSRDHLLSMISDPWNFIVCDMRTGDGFGWVSRDTAANTAFFRYHFLEAAALTMIEQLYLAPVHGALVARNGTGVLLCGDTGAGKSTLALACGLAGWDFVSDDGTYLLRNRSDLYAVGNSHVIRLRADSARLFPNLQDRAPELRPNGKVGFELFTRDVRVGIQPMDAAVVKHVVFLKRASGTAPLLTAEVHSQRASYFQRTLRYGEEQVQREQSEAYRRLNAARFWELRYSHFDEGVRMLDLLVEERRNST